MEIAQIMSEGYFKIILLIIFTVYPLWLLKRLILD